jgi:superfamily II DNA or RNA helicase
MSVVKFIKIDEVFCSVDAEYSVFLELAEAFTFEIPNKRFHPLVQEGKWDGKIRLINKMNHLMYSGLIPQVVEHAESMGLEVEVDVEYAQTAFSDHEAQEFIKGLNARHAPYDFQLDAFVQCIQNRRQLVISPTSSGKSFLMYLLLMYLGVKTIIVAPSVGLVKQLATEIKSYGYPGDIHQIMKGASKESDCQLTISTWQSIYLLPKKYFKQYECLIADEVHRFDSKSLKTLVEKTVATRYKYGVTGSLDESKTHQLVLTGMFGQIYETITTKEMIDRDIASDIEIKVMVFSYPEKDTRQLHSDRSYKDEVEFIIRHPLRNIFIANLANSLPGNGLILFRRVAHGKLLQKLIERANKKDVHFIAGETDVDVREEIRQIMENHDNIVALASDGTTATGISINNIQWMIKVQPVKSVINNKQSIGRGLRKDGKDNKLTYFDLADELPPSKTRTRGYLYDHLVRRIRLYVKSKFKYKIYKIRLDK